MAITPTPEPWTSAILYDNEDIKYEEFAIGGKLIKAQLHIRDSDIIQLEDDPNYKDVIKLKLVNMLAEYMLDNKFIEFTQHQDPSTMSRTIFARCYVAPDSQVKILKTLKK